jgi:DNA-binding NtrC family response regulator
MPHCSRQSTTANSPTRSTAERCRAEARVNLPRPDAYRELRNIVERASLLADNGSIEARHLPDAVRRAGDSLARGQGRMTARKPLQAAEIAALREAVRIHGGSRRELAAALGMSERTLYRKLRALEA